jgi:hypothetical protein
MCQQILDRSIRKYTGFDSFEGLVNSFPTYRPSLETNPFSKEGRALRIIADRYDKHMERIGDSRRAYRFGLFKS